MNKIDHTQQSIPIKNGQVEAMAGCEYSFYFAVSLCKLDR